MSTRRDGAASPGDSLPAGDLIPNMSTATEAATEQAARRVERALYSDGCQKCVTELRAPGMVLCFSCLEAWEAYNVEHCDGGAHVFEFQGWLAL